MKSRRSKTVVRWLLAVLAIVAIGVGWVLYAMNRVQPFYAEALQAKPRELARAGRRMEERVSRLQEQAARRGDWETVFTDDEVNGWLANYLAEKRDELLPPEVVDPRVAFVPGGCKIGFRYLGQRLDAVISIEADAFMAANNVAAVRLRNAYLGALPLAMDDVVEKINTGAATLGLPIRWAEQEQDPVLLLAVVDALSTGDELRQLEKLELRDGELMLAGKTESRQAVDLRAAQQAPTTAGR